MNTTKLSFAYNTVYGFHALFFGLLVIINVAAVFNVVIVAETYFLLNVCVCVWNIFIIQFSLLWTTSSWKVEQEWKKGTCVYCCLNDLCCCGKCWQVISNEVCTISKPYQWIFVAQNVANVFQRFLFLLFFRLALSTNSLEEWNSKSQSHIVLYWCKRCKMLFIV